MKRIEKILGLTALIAVILKLLLIPGGGALLTLSLAPLAIYYYLSFAILNDIQLKDIFKKESYNGITPLKMIGVIVFGLTLSAITIGALFYLQFWPGAFIQLQAGFVFLLIIFIVSLIRYNKNKSGFYKRIFIRAIIFGGVSILLLSTPPIAFFEIFHRDNPDYVSAVKKSWADPNNEELLKERERQQELNLNRQ